MPDALALSKVTAPLLPPTTLYRASLIQKLNETIGSPGGKTFSYKLVLVCAPAGYGKTLLIADFARRTDIPCCWHFLDSADTDRITFLKTLLLSIRHHFPQFGKTLDSLLTDTAQEIVDGAQSPHFFERFVDAFIAAVETEIAERFAIFFCNYHELNRSDGVNALINRFLEHLPSRCLIVIESRTIPKLEFAPLITQRKILSLGRNMLRFTAQEIRDLALLQGITSLGEAEAEQLAASFEGWIAGILLGTRLGDIQFLDRTRSSDAHPSSSLIQGTHKELFTYLLSEVFSRDLETYTFLKYASVLRHMTPSICNDLLHITNAGERLHYLEQQGFFVIRNGEEQEMIYTCHPLVRGLLSNELRQQSPEQFAALHQRAAELFQAADDYTQAIYHAFQADQWHLAASIIMAAQEKMLAQGQLETLARWIDRLLPMTPSLHPTLLLVRTKIYLHFGEYAHALSLLNTTSRAIADQSSVLHVDDVLTLQAQVKLLHSKVLFQKGDYSQAQALCQDVLDSVSVDEVALRAETYARLGVGANLLGDFHTGIAHLQKALHLWGRDTRGRRTADLHSALASTYGLIGNFALAEHHLTRALACWNYLRNDWGIIDNLIRQGLIKHYQGNFPEAETDFTRALELSRGPLHFLREEAYTLVSLGELYQDQGSYNQALTCLDDGLALARQMEDKYLTNYTLRMLAMTYLLMEDVSTARLLVSEMQTEKMESSNYERVLRELIDGAILLYEQHFREAYVCLTAIEGPLRQMGLRREQIRLTLFISACQLALGDNAEVIRRMEELLTTTRRDNLERFITTELYRLPELERFVETQLKTSYARIYLQRARAGQEEEEPETSSPASAASPTVTLPRPDQPVLSIYALGEPAIMLDRTPVTNWHLARAMELVFFLLERDGPVHKEQIFVALWPDAEGQIEQTLRTNVYYARKVLGEKAIVYRAGKYALQLAPFYSVQYDAAIFQGHHAKAKKALATDDIAQAKDELLKMVDLYRGDYVQSFYSDWCIFRRDELRQAYLDAQHHLAQIAWSQKRIDESLSHWKHILTVDSCFEEAHYGLIRCYLDQGKRGSALRQYQRCAETLKSELGVEPGPALQSLYQRLISSQ